MDSNKVILIQGPTKYAIQMIDKWKTSYPIYWSTWKDEPIENLKLIENSHIKLILFDKPALCGQHNRLLQRDSTLLGAKYLKVLGYNEFFKIRGDFVVDQPEEFILIHSEKFAKNGLPVAFSYSSGTLGIVQDWILYGSLQDLEDYYGIPDSKANNFECPEMSYIKNFCARRDIDYNSVRWNPREMMKYFNYSIKETIEKNISGHLPRFGVDLKHWGLNDPNWFVDYE